LALISRNLTSHAILSRSISTKNLSDSKARQARRATLNILRRTLCYFLATFVRTARMVAKSL
jgi:hypothetical protein